MCKFSLKASMQKKFAKIIRKTCAIYFLLFKAFQRAIKLPKIKIDLVK